jgi:hypothetical protein
MLNKVSICFAPFPNSFDQEGKVQSRFFVATLLRMTRESKARRWVMSATRIGANAEKFAHAAKTFNYTNTKSTKEISIRKDEKPKA